MRFLQRSDKIKLTLGASVSTHVYMEWEDGKQYREDWQLSSSGTTTILNTGTRSGIRSVGSLFIANRGGSDQTVTLLISLGSTESVIYSGTLGAGETLSWLTTTGFVKLDALGGSQAPSTGVFSASTAGYVPAPGSETDLFLRDDGSWATPDPVDTWTYVILGSNAVNSTTANNDTNLFFTPEANKKYIVEAWLYLQAAATTTGARPGIAWPTGLDQNAAWAISPTSATAFVSRFWGNTAAANAASTGVAVMDEGIFGMINAMFVTGSYPSGNFTITIASEIAASEARIMANSFLRYRTIE